MSDPAFYRGLVERVRAEGFEVEEKTGTHFRVNGRLDVYPVSRRFHDIKHNHRGGYLDMIGFVKQFFRNVSHETSPVVMHEGPSLPPEIIRGNAVRDCIEVVHESLTWDDEIPSDPEEARRELKRAILARLEQLK